MLQDLRFAWRLLRSRPGFTLAAFVPLALAIACATAVLSLVDAVLYRPLGVADPARLVSVYGYSRAKAAWLSDSYADFRDLSSLGDVVESSAAFVRMPMNADLGAGTERLAAEMVTGDYFRTVGVVPAAGRALGPEDDRPEAPPALVISDALWNSHFGRSLAAIGSTVRIADVACTVVGVMPAGYAGTLLDWGAVPSFWIPLAHIPRLVPAFASLDYHNRRDMRWLMVSVRLKPGVAVPSAQAAMDVLESRWKAVNPAIYADHRLVVLSSGQARFFPAYREAAQRFLYLLAAVAAAVLLIACFNLVNLLLARVAAREKETTTRLALGASRGRILRQFLVEGFLLAGCAVVVGLPLSIWLTRWLAAFPQFLSITLNLNLSPDLRALLASGMTSLAAGALIGAIAALRAGRSDLLSGLNNAQARPMSGSALPSVRDLLVSGQVACAMVVLISAAMLAGSLRDLEYVRLGYDTRGALIANVDITDSHRTAPSCQQFYRALLAELRSQAEGGAALMWEALPANSRWTRQLTAEGSGTAATDVEGNVVSDGFFKVLGMSLESGREFLPTDDGQSQPIVILNRSAANLFWPGENAVGRSVLIGGETAARLVVGVAADAQYHPLATNRVPYFFLPLSQSLRTQVMVCVRTPGGAPLAFVPLLRRTVRQLDRNASLLAIRTFQEQVESGFAQVRLAAFATTAVSLLGTVLALVGVFAMTAWRVMQQRRDIAIRIALGADQREVVTAFAAKGFATGLVGAAAGVLLAVWATGLLRSSLRGLTAPGVAVFLAASAVLLLFVFAASVIPARRVLGIDPASLLRVQ
ncbi:MAG TPA: ADOP family duplicated permease [Bryobacteraceae bacterium]